MTTPEEDHTKIHASPEIMENLRRIAEIQGKTLYEVIDQALRTYIQRYHEEHTRNVVMSAFADSLDEFGGLYRKTVD